MMMREPPTVPALPGVYALVNKSERYAYVGHTTNLMKRSHSLSHMLIKHDKHPKTAYWSIADLPKRPSGAHTFMMLAPNVALRDAPAAIAAAQSTFRAKKYRVIGGNRAAPMVVCPCAPMKGKVVSLADALRMSKSGVQYPTAWRRLERGWTVEQALGLAEPDPRWDREKARERRARADKLQEASL